MFFASLALICLFLPCVASAADFLSRIITISQASLTSTSLTLYLNDPGAGPSFTWLVGKNIMVDDEIMRCEAVFGGMLTVIRGQLSTVAVLHLAVKGGGTCDCSTTGTPSGAPAGAGDVCRCTEVFVVYPQATTRQVGRFDGFDNVIGTAGENPAVGSDGCKVGSAFWGQGCNINKVAFPGGVRSFQAATLAAGMSKTYWLSNCGTKESDACNAGGLCKCSTPTMLPNMDFGNPVQLTDELVYFRSTGDPLGWSRVPTTSLLIDVGASVDVESFVLGDGSEVDAAYLRLDDEIVYVTSARSRGVRAVSLYQATGVPSTGACSCSFTGNATGGGTCSCYPQGVISGCSADGTLIGVDSGGGNGFAAFFTVANGYIDNIVVTNPGKNYVSVPALQIELGGTGCTFLPGQYFIPVLSTEVVGVSRGALGTTPTSHTAGTSVSKITWPLRDTANAPGTQYYFRIAAYNDAGLSNFVYYEHSIIDMVPRELSTTGGVQIEIIMLGAGTTPANTTVYIGHRTFNGSIDYGRSKLCPALTVIDVAGTRLTCVSPPWVGKRHDLLVRYVSGIEERLSVGDAFVSYPAPILTSISPVQVPSGQTAVVTISGANFGTNETDVVGVLITNEGQIACTPMKLLSDKAVTCTLPVTTGVPFTGRFVVGVGTAFSGGQQNTTETGQPAKLKEYDLPAEVTLKLSIDISTIPAGSVARVQFETNFRRDIATATTIAEWRVQIKSILPGSIVIVFVICNVPDPTPYPRQPCPLLAQAYTSHVDDHTIPCRPSGQSSHKQQTPSMVSTNINTVPARISKQTIVGRPFLAHLLCSMPSSTPLPERVSSPPCSATSPAF